MPVSADLIVTHGVIHTLDPSERVASSLAVAGGRIIYVGDDREALHYKGRSTRIVDLQGRAVLPGLVDAHVHPTLGEYLDFRLCNVRAFSLAESLDKVRNCAATAPPGDWVVGYGAYDLDDPAFDQLTREQLDALVPDRKLAILSKDLHTAWVNSRTLKSFGIGHDTKSPPGGEIVRDPRSGEPSGELIDSANEIIWRAIMHESGYGASTEELLRSAMAHLNSLGITSILDAYTEDDEAQAYHDLDLRGQLTMRVSIAPPVDPGNYRARIDQIAGRRTAWQSPRVRLDFVKVFADGNAEVGLASLLNHDGPPETATPGYYTDAQMRELVALAERSELSIFVHVIGDGAARQVLDAIAAARLRTPLTDRRHTLTHLCWVSSADLPRFRQLGVIANIQEGWLAPAAFGGPPGYDYARSTAAGPIGPWLAGRLLPYRELRDAGARLAAGSDWYYTQENPWYTIESGMTSRDPGGSNSRAMLANETLTLLDLIRARTTGAAYQLYREEEIGQIAVGYRADFIVLDRDPFRVPTQTLHETKVLITFLDGALVYSR